jgi:putative effector of murein hydrolase
MVPIFGTLSKVVLAKAHPAPHGIGTAHAFQFSSDRPIVGAFSDLAMGLGALFSAVVLLGFCCVAMSLVE